MKAFVLFALCGGSLTLMAQNVNVSGCTGAGNVVGAATLSAAMSGIALAQPGANIVIDIVGNTTEPVTTITIGAGTWTTMLIRPQGGAARTITAATTAGIPMIDLNGADNVTVDGLNTGGNTLTISNTTVSATSGTSTLRFQIDATNNTITRCSIRGSSTMSTTTNGGNIWFGAGALTTGSDGNTISSCNIGPAGANLPTKAIYANGTTTTAALNNSGVSVTGCNIFDWFAATGTSNGIYVAGGNRDWNITNNRIYQTAPRNTTATATIIPIQVANTVSPTNMVITGNTIGFANSSGTGTWDITGTGNTFIGMALSGLTTGAPTFSVQNNTISGINVSTTIGGSTSSAPFRGVYVSSGTIDFGTTAGNTIGS